MKKILTMLISFLMIIPLGTTSILAASSEKIEITGTVTISTSCKFGDTLIADISGVNPQDATLTYQWYIDGAELQNAKENTYIINCVGSIITVRVTGYGNFQGSITSNSVVPEKATQPTPPVTLYIKGNDRIILWYYDLCEYRVEGGEWQDSSKFTGLLPNTTYKFYARRKEYTYYKASPASEFFIKTANAPLTYLIIHGNGYTDKMTINDFKSSFSNDFMAKDLNGDAINGDKFIGTGMKISFSENNYTVVLKGDINGDGKVDAKDYMLTKKAYLGTYMLSEMQLAAACFENTSLPTSKDYLKIKRHFLETYNIHI